MKETKIIAKAENFTATDFGKMSEIKDYTLEMGPEIKIPGKVFGGQSVNATGGEFSFQSFAPGTETGFLDTHKNHEELYFFLSLSNPRTQNSAFFAHTGSYYSGYRWDLEGERMPFFPLVDP